MPAVPPVGQSGRFWLIATLGEEAGGKRAGAWEQQEELLFPQNGGHGMLFTKRDGRMVYTLHYPNDRYLEHPIFLDFMETDDKLKL